MRFYEKVLKDIRQFENYDSYFTIILAIVISLGSLFFTWFSAHIASLTLALLGMLAFTNLMNRHRYSEMKDAFSNSADSFFMNEFPPDKKTNFEISTDTWLMGVSLHRAITFNYEKIEQKLRQGHSFKVMVVHPEGPGIEMAMLRNYPVQEVAPKATSIRNTLRLLCKLQKTAPELMEIRTTKYPLSYGVQVSNPELTSGVLYLEHYTFGISSESLPRYVVRASDGSWYDFFKKEIQALWSQGEIWNCEKGSQKQKQE